MATPRTLHRWAAMQALTILPLLVVLVQGGNHWGNDACPTFSCGPLANVSFPFRRAGDPSGCGVKSCELDCTNTKATVRIADATYYVMSINYTASTFRVIDANLDLHSSCPHLPRWNQRPREYWDTTGEEYWLWLDEDIGANLDPVMYNMASFLECSRDVKNKGMYMPVACMSTSDSFVYVLTGPGAFRVENLEPCCGYLAMTPLGGPENPLDTVATRLGNMSYMDVVKSMRSGFSVRYPLSWRFRDCLLRLLRTFREEPLQRAFIILNPGQYIIQCGIEAAPSQYIRIFLVVALYATNYFSFIGMPKTCQFCNFMVK
uniref:Uncharacterized protein n=1 Tax=Avena sativa TaxID=4498 RepID=A0ACD5TSN7_AVESA